MEQKAEDKTKMNKKPQDTNRKSISKKKNKMIKRKRYRERDLEKEEKKTDSEKINRKNSTGQEQTNFGEMKEDKIFLELSEIKNSEKHWEKINKEEIKEFLTRNKEFVFGNYDRYYYKRYLDVLKEPRLGVFQTDWFKDKRCLDIGCNDGTVAIMIAVCYQPRNIEGIDIDYRLIKNAIKNMKYVMRNNLSKSMLESFLKTENFFKEPEGNTSNLNNLNTSDINSYVENKNNIMQMIPENLLNESSKMKEILDRISSMPKSFLINLGYPSNNSSLNRNEKLITFKNEDNLNFPKNISFSQENYIAEIKVEEKYDTILCLSTSKWIHLNYGDVGIKLLFHNVYKQLKTGGMFIFEPQGWKSYKKRKNLTDTIRKNFSEINLKPEHFQKYLENIYEFECIHISNPPSNSKISYDRPIYVFKKK